MWNTIFSAVTAVATLLIIVEIMISLKQKRDLHDEQRRQKTVEIMMEWSKSLLKETSFAEKLVEGFNEEQCRALCKQIPFKVDKKTKEDFCKICPDSDCAMCNDCKKSTESTYTIDGKQLSELRWYIVTYLNLLETVLVAWKQNVVDREIIEHEFSYLYDESKGWDVLSGFRNAAGGKKVYPVIDEFCEKLKCNSDEKSIMKNKSKLK